MSAVVHWPTAVDYQTALQTPSLCFNDPVLRQGTVLSDERGLPLAATGNVVVVFRMRLAGGDVALRCFTRSVSFETLARRYHALNQHLEAVDVPAFVPCTYQPDEILVNGARYPIVGMSWMPGLHLHRYIEQHVLAPDVLHALADQWRILMNQMRMARLAHGDLADGNVLVNERGQLHLIDYDAAFVPALEADPPQEVGKPNYQHPDRLLPDSPDYGYYGENIDAFAALSIYVSLRALAEDADRWRCYHTGENLIFEQEDYQNPGYTPIWLDLRSGQSDEVKRLVAVLEGFCRASVVDLPNLEEAIKGWEPRRRESVPKVKTPPLAEDKAPVPPPSTAPPAEEVAAEPVPETRRDLAALVRTFYLPGLVVAAVLALVVLVSLQERADGLMRTVNLVSPSDAIATPVPSEVLPGFYTGYATSLDGAREPMALIIDSLEVHPDSVDVRFTYSVNWKADHVGGTGHYNRATGYVDLENHYVLYIARATADEVVLASLAQRKQRPLVVVNKRRIP